MNYEEYSQKKNIVVFSFDIFDTLIFRSVSSPNDIFDIVQYKYRENKLGSENDFKNKRIKAESEARSLASDEITYQDIYSCIALNDKDKYAFYRLEIETEIECCLPNNDVISILKKLHDDEKRVIIVSDMYLPQDTIEAMLNKCGIYKEFYEKLYLSSSVGFTKLSGRLFEYVIEDLKISGSRILHSGDNMITDINNAKKYSINTISVEPFKKEISYWDKNHATKMIVNHLINFLKCKSINSVNTFYNLGYELVGPIVFSYCNWLYREIKKNRIDKILFLSREGFLLKVVFDKLFPDQRNNSIYFSANRNTLLYPILYLDHSIDNFFENLPILYDRYSYFDLLICLSVKRDEKYIWSILKKFNAPAEKFTLDELKSSVEFEEIYNFIIEENQLQYFEQYELLKEYLFLNNISGRVILVNNSMGASAQKKLDKILTHENMNVELWNAHFIRKKSLENSKYKSITWFDDTCSEFNKKVFFQDCLLFEHLLFKDTGTALYYNRSDSKISVIHDERGYETENDHFMEQFRTGVLEFIDDYSSTCPLEIPSQDCLNAWNCFLRWPTSEHAEAVSKLWNYEDGKNNRFITNNIDESMWRQGAFVFTNQIYKLKIYNLKTFVRMHLRRRQWC